MMRLGFLFGAALAAWSWLGGSAAAQPVEIPCEIPPTITIETTLPLNDSFGGNGLESLLDQALQRCLAGVNDDEVERRLEDHRKKLLANPFAPGTLSPRGSFSYLWRTALEYTHLSFDEYEGEALEEISVDRVHFEISRLLAGGSPRASVLGLRIPWLWLESERPGLPRSAEGVGDIHFFGSHSLPFGERGDRLAHQLEWQLSLPTGDEDEALGVGEMVARLGWRGLLWGSGREGTKSFGGAQPELVQQWAEWEFARVEPTSACRVTDRPVPPDAEGWEISGGLTYERMLDGDGHDLLEGSFEWATFSDRWALELGTRIRHELSGPPPGIMREDATTLDVGGSLWIRLEAGKRRPGDSTYLRVGLSSRVTDDGLVDRLTPTIGVHHFWN